MADETTTHTLTVPGASIHYEVRGSGPVLLIAGTPMGGSWFRPLAEWFADAYTVVTYDPRGISRSVPDDPGQDVPPETFATDLHHLLAAVTSEPADVFASSGGAICGLALATLYPEQIRRLVAHEPPLIELLPDAAAKRAKVEELYAGFLASGPAGAWPRFMELILGDDVPPAPPAEATDGEGPPDAEREANDLFFFGHIIRQVSLWQPPFDQLRAVADKLVIAAGSTNRGELAHRAAVALADRLDSPLVEFPGDHDGFLGETTDAFARRLREVLTFDG